MGLDTWKSNLNGGKYTTPSNARKAMGGHKLSEAEKKEAEKAMDGWFAADNTAASTPAPKAGKKKGAKTPGKKGSAPKAASVSESTTVTVAPVLNGAGDTMMELIKLAQAGTLSVPAFKAAATGVLSAL